MCALNRALNRANLLNLGSRAFVLLLCVCVDQRGGGRRERWCEREGGRESSGNVQREGSWLSWKAEWLHGKGGGNVPPGPNAVQLHVPSTKVEHPALLGRNCMNCPVYILGTANKLHHTTHTTLLHTHTFTARFHPLRPARTQPGTAVEFCSSSIAASTEVARCERKGYWWFSRLFMVHVDPSSCSPPGSTGRGSIPSNCGLQRRNDQ